MYENAFRGMEGVGFPDALPGGKHARHLFTIWVKPGIRDKVLWGLQERGVGVAVNFRAIHLLKFYRENFSFKEGMFPSAEAVGASTISLPTYPKLTNTEVEFVVDSVRAVLRGEAC